MPEEPILPIDDPRLTQPSAAIEHIDDAVLALVDRMFAVMDRANGAGLAAIQVGEPRRLVVMDVADSAGKRHRLAMINPEIIELSKNVRVNIEGCLSMPDYDVPVARATRATARYVDLSGRDRVISGDGALSICLQHEIDHVNGILFTDRVSRLRRDRARAHFAKVRRRAEWH